LKVKLQNENIRPRKPVGRVMMKGENITLIQSADGQSEGQ
jgi:hypothetical protein